LDQVSFNHCRDCETLEQILKITKEAKEWEHFSGVMEGRKVVVANKWETSINSPEYLVE
jgi:hypothetical protein